MNGGNRHNINTVIHNVILIRIIHNTGEFPAYYDTLQNGHPIIFIPDHPDAQLEQKGSDLKSTSTWDLFHLRFEQFWFKSKHLWFRSEVKKIPS